MISSKTLLAEGGFYVYLTFTFIFTDNESGNH